MNIDDVVQELREHRNKIDAAIRALEGVEGGNLLLRFFEIFSNTTPLWLIMNVLIPESPYWARVSKNGKATAHLAIDDVSLRSAFRI